jgi:hypothetical protein
MVPKSSPSRYLAAYRKSMIETVMVMMAEGRKRSEMRRNRAEA